DHPRHLAFSERGPNQALHVAVRLQAADADSGKDRAIRPRRRIGAPTRRRGVHGDLPKADEPRRGVSLLLPEPRAVERGGAAESRAGDVTCKGDRPRASGSPNGKPAALRHTPPLDATTVPQRVSNAPEGGCAKFLHSTPFWRTPPSFPCQGSPMGRPERLLFCAAF